MGVVFMGGCLEKLSPEDKELAKKNRAIENFLKNERRNMEDDVKLLLLGTGGSGKSTIAKQMKIIHLSGFPENERIGFKNIIYHNVVRAMATLIEEAQARDLPIEDEDSAQIVLDVPLNGSAISYTTNVSNAVESLWKDKS